MSVLITGVVIKLACEAAVGKRPWFEVHGTDYDTDGSSAVRDFIHVADLANAHHVALRFLRDGGRKFTANAGYTKGASVLQVVGAVKRISGGNFKARMMPRRAGDIPAIVADASRLGSRLSWTPKHDDLDRIIGDALASEEKLAARAA